MKQYIGCDLHRDYLVFASVDESGRITGPLRVEHDRKGLRAFLRKFPAGTEIAVEATGSWYWMIDELEAAGLQPRLADSYEAKQPIRGLHRSGLLDYNPAASTWFDSHGVALPPAEAAQMPWRGRSGGGAAPGGIDLVDFEKQTALPRAGTARGVFVHARASAA